MLALYRQGRQGDALEAYRRARAELSDGLGVDPGPRLRELEAQVLAQDPGLLAVSAQTRQPCPYKGLARYDAADADLFVGRERLVEELVARLVDERFLVVVGPSGAGKSSLVRAGLVPALAGGALPGSDAWPVVVMVPGAEPLEALEAALADRLAVLVVDQAEEALLADDGAYLIPFGDRLLDCGRRRDPRRARPEGGLLRAAGRALRAGPARRPGHGAGRAAGRAGAAPHHHRAGGPGGTAGRAGSGRPGRGRGPRSSRGAAGPVHRAGTHLGAPRRRHVVGGLLPRRRRGRGGAAAGRRRGVGGVGRRRRSARPAAGCCCGWR